MNQDGGNTPAGATSVTLDEMEASAQENTGTKVDLSSIKLDADGMPEELKGKSAAEIIEYAKGLKEAVRVSEQARLAAQQQTDVLLRTQPTPEQVQRPDPTPELTKEQLAELFQNDPIAAMDAISQQTTRRVAAQYEERLQPLLRGNVDSAERRAREQYADEFTLFGKDIDSIVAQIPGGRAAMVSDAAWSDLIALIRGRPGNFEKILDHKTTKSAPRPTREEVAEGNSGVSMRSTSQGRAPASQGKLDATQLEIADKLGLSPEEYINWSKV